jgi:hypothetical protein
MCNILSVRWTVIPQTAPQPWLACSGCGTLKPFQCSGKTWLNANGRRLDAWLIYKCAACDKTWNRPIFERQTIAGIDPATLDALQSNDPDFIRREAFNLDALRRKTKRIDEFAEIDIRKETLCDSRGWTALEIEFAVPLPVSTRLDRLLAAELGVSRSWLQAMQERAVLRTIPDRPDSLRKRIKTGLVLRFDLADETDLEEKWRSLATSSPLVGEDSKAARGRADRLAALGEGFCDGAD